MKPEVRRILDKIGYSQALQCSRSLWLHSWEPNDRGNRLFENKVEAKDSLRKLHEITALFQETSPHLLNLINDHAKNSVDWDQGRDPLVDVAQAIGGLIGMAGKENNSIWDGHGASRRIAAEDIAKDMAQIYVLGLGKMPGSGAKSDGSPSGRFPKAVYQVFLELNRPDNFRRPCKQAVAWLKADDRKEFKRFIHQRELRGRKLSLFGSEQN